jgi:hypothetical protein
MANISMGRNYFIEDEEYGKLYLIKNPDERFIFITDKYILLADQPNVTDSKIVLFKGRFEIKQKKLHYEPKELSMNYKELKKLHRTKYPRLQESGVNPERQDALGFYL